MIGFQYVDGKLFIKKIPLESSPREVPSHSEGN
jgi:hypothetical protein